MAVLPYTAMMMMTKAQRHRHRHRNRSRCHRNTFSVNIHLSSSSEYQPHIMWSKGNITHHNIIASGKRMRHQTVKTNKSQSEIASSQ